MTLSNLRVTINTPPGGSASYTFTVRKNAAATALTCVISGANTSAQDTTNSVSFAAGDIISLQSVPASTPAAMTDSSWSIQQSATALFAALGGSTSNPSNSVSNYNGLQSGGSWNAAETKVYSPVPAGGIFSNLYVVLVTAPGTGTSFTFTLMKNGVATALTTTVSDTATTGNDTSHAVSVSPSDTVSIQTTPANTPLSTVALHWGLSFAPTNDGQSFFLYGDQSSPSTTVVNYEQPLGRGATVWNATQTTQIMRLQAGILGALYTLLTVAPGGATSYTIAVQKNAITSALSTAISGATTTGNIATNVVASNDDTFTLVSTPAGTTPASTTVHVGILYIASDTGVPLLLLGVG